MKVSIEDVKMRRALENIRETVQAETDALIDPDCRECNPEWQAPDVAMLNGLLGFLDAALDTLPVEEEDDEETWPKEWNVERKGEF